ncbi:hypothetical protein QBC43DRAFT_309667 [Cladorrhinum sp. PSN259]|nr:hypothetical protein QBC43DRAFT_309667 [Cladorrhinum sp. PSN259]
MRVTPPSLRRRNTARVEIRSRDRWVARRHGDEDHEDGDGDHMDGEDHDHDDDDSDSSDSDSDDEDELPTSTQPAPGGGVGVITLPGVNNGAQLPGVTLGADEGIDADIDSDSDSDDDETTTAPNPSATSTTAPPAASTLPTTSVPQITSGTAPYVSDVSRTSSLSTASPTVEPTLLPTLDASLTVPAAGGAQQSGDTIVPIPEAETLPNLPLQEANGMSGGAAAGIVIGVLAIIGLMVGAAFYWRKYRRDRGLSFLPVATPFSKKRDGNDQYADNNNNNNNNINPKTNTKIMDDLMKATYDAENGGNDMAGAGYGYWDKKYASQLPTQQQSAWLDEKAFVALGGELTPRTPKKPVSRWLEAVQTPRQSRGPAFPPSERMSRSSRQSTMRFPIRLSTSPPRNPAVPQANNGLRPPMPGTIAGDRLEPPKPAYNARETMTTDTTSTSVRWYG